MGRLSTFAKNRILNLRFQKSYRIKQIAQTLLTEDNIKVSRKSISTFLKKYIETKSINDKPRSGRNKKLTPEEINLIGEVTRLNRDITAPKIKEYLNLNVSTYTILRASKLFEWNKLNPNSNEAKRQAALERQLNGEASSSSSGIAIGPSVGSSISSGSGGSNSSSSISGSTKPKNRSKSTNQTQSVTQTVQVNPVLPTLVTLTNTTTIKTEKRHVRKKTGPKPVTADDHYDPSTVSHLNLVNESEVTFIKNVSSSPMVFATKILYKIFKLEELIGHNVSGKTFNKFIKNKKALDEKRVNYIRFLVENNFDSSDREELWKSCRTAINKCIRNNEIKYAQSMGVPPNNLVIFRHKEESSSEETSGGNYIDMEDNLIRISCPPVQATTPTKTIHLPITDSTTPQTNEDASTTIVTLVPTMSIFQMSTSDEALNTTTSRLPTTTTTTRIIMDEPVVAAAATGAAVSTRTTRLGSKSTRSNDSSIQPTIVKLTDLDKDFDDDCKALLDLNNKSVKSDETDEEDDETTETTELMNHTNERLRIQNNHYHHISYDEEETSEVDENNSSNRTMVKLSLLTDAELDEMKNQCCCSPMIFATKILARVFTKDELIGHNVSGKTYHRNLKDKRPLDEQRMSYIRSLVEAYFPQRKMDVTWRACRKAINRVIRNVEIKESKLNKSIDVDTDDINFLIFNKR